MQLIIRKLRVEKGISARDLAGKIGVSSAYVSQLEKGQRSNPSKSLLADIANQLGCSVDDLYERDGHNTPSTLSVREYPVGPDLGQPSQLCRYPAECDLMKELAANRAEIAAMKATLDTVVSLLGASLRIAAPGEKKVG